MTAAFSNILLSELDKQGMTQKQLAEKSGITEAAISRYLSGERTPRSVFLAKIAKALGVSSDYLLGESTADADVDSAVRLIARNAKSISEEQYRSLVEALKDREVHFK